MVKVPCYLTPDPNAKDSLMNILFLTTHLNVGGITSYLLTLTKGLIKQGHGVFLASSSGEMLEAFQSLGVEHLKLNISTKSELDPRIYLALGRLRRFIKQKDIHVVHTQTRVTQVMGFCLGRITEIPYLSTCHGFFKTRLSRKIFPCWGECVIAISEAVRDHLLKDFRVDPKRCVLIKNGIDSDDFLAIDEDTRRKNRQRFHLEHNRVIGIIARLSDVKGHDILIKAMGKVIQQFPDARLLIVGEGPRKEPLQRMVKELNLNEHVQFYPIVNHTAEMLSLLDVFVLPSFEEGLGLSVMEAQAAGLSVVASKVGGLPQLIDDGRTGLLVHPKNADLLSEAILFLLRNPQKARQMGKEAQEFIQKEFSAQRMVNETLALYKQFIGRR